MTAENSKLSQAEDAVTGSLNKLENVMEDLTNKIETTSQKIQHVVDLGTRQKEEIMRLKDATKDRVLGAYSQTRDFGQRLYSDMRSNPRPYIFGGLLLLAAVFAYSYSGAGRRRSLESSPEPMTSSPYIEDPGTVDIAV